MGTSGSSSGPVGGVPFDPPWLDEIENPQPAEDGQGSGDVGDEQPPEPVKPSGIAPPARFRNARRLLRQFVRTGDQESLRKAVGHYSRTGMGGAHNVASRMRTSTRSAGRLFGVLQSAREGTEPAINEWVASLIGRNASAQDVVDEIIRRVSPNGGSLDEASCQDSMARAMQDLLEEDPNVNLLHLEEDGIFILIESFIGYEAFNRLCLDIGQVFEKSGLSHRDTVKRMEEIRDYLKAEVTAQIEQLRKTMANTSKSLEVILRRALHNTFLVYEGAL